MRNRLTALLILLAAVAAPIGAGFVLPEPSYYTPAVRLDPSDSNYFSGYLTWKAGQGAIMWDAAAPSEDPGGPPPDASAETGHGVNQASGWYAGVRSPPVRVDTFTSAPLPRTLHVNASRHLQLDLFITNREDSSNRNYYDACAAYSNGKAVSYQPDPDLRVQVLLDGKLVAGAVISQYIEWWWTGSGRPADPAPYSGCFYRMPLETVEFPKGSTVTVKIEVLSMSRGFQYGLGEDHRSVLRIPVFSDDEWLFRDPKATAQQVGGEAAEAAAAGEDEGAVLLPLASVGVLGLTLRARRGRLTPILVALVLASGCFGGGGQDSSSGIHGDVKVSIDPTNATSGGGPALGMIAGLIHDDLHVPLYGVHVSLLGTSNFTRSDGQGRFTIKDLSAGRFEIRFDKEGFVSVQQWVEVVASAITRLDVTLIPEELKESGRRNHRHDYWLGEKQKRVWEGDLKSVCNGGTSCRPVTEFSIPPPDDGTIRSILPGTQEVLVTLNWNPTQMGYDKVGLRFSGANEAYFDNGSLLYPRGPGQPFRIATTWEMSDPGHMVGSTWSFQIYADPADNPPYVEDWVNIVRPLADTSAPSFQVKIEIVKGAVPLEPGHPDHWGGNTVIPALVNGRTSLPGNLYLPGTGYYQTPTAYVAPSKVVPFDAGWVELNITPSRDTVPANEWVVWVKTGASGFKDVWFYQYYSTSLGPEFRKVGEPTQEGGKLRWKIPLKAGDADNPYARRSSWVFAIQPKDETAFWVDYWGPSWALKPIEFTVSAASHREPSS